MKSPLRNQIFFPIAGLLALAIVLFTGMSTWHAVEVRREQSAQHLEAIARALGSASYPLTRDVVQRIGAMIGGDLVVLDDQQQVTASTLKSPAQLQTLLVKLPSASDDASSPQVIHSQTNSYLVTSIRRSHVRDPATLFVILPRDEFPVVWRNSIAAPLIVAMIILVLALFLAMLISGRIAGRVDQLRALFARLAHGDFQAVVASGRDDEIRDLMQSANALSEQLRSMQQELLNAQRLKLLGQLSGGLAHQLKNSVAGARLAIQLHQRRCTTNDPMIQTALAQLALTEEQVMAVVSLKAEEASAETRETCDIARLMHDVVTLLQPHCTHWKSRITLHAPDELPAILNSPQSLKGGLLNLTQNAIEAAGTGGTIECFVACDDEWITIEIRDSGAGFLLDQQELAAAFRSTKPEGIGLGLTIAQHAVDQEHGALTISRVDNQTSVRLRLPRVRAESTADVSTRTVAAASEKADRP